MILGRLLAATSLHSTSAGSTRVDAAELTAGREAIATYILAGFALVSRASHRESSPKTIAPRWLTSAASIAAAVLGAYGFVERVAGRTDVARRALTGSK